MNYLGGGSPKGIDEMVMWGALEIDTDEAAREVLEHTVVATVAHISERFSASRDRLAVAWFTAQPGDADGKLDSATPLRWMERMENLLQAAGARPRWHGLGAFVWVMNIPTLASAAAAARTVAAVPSVCAASFRHGVAHGDEAGDPVDLLRMAAHRSSSTGRNSGSYTGRPSMTPVHVATSEGERARLGLISENRAREVEPLFREALDLLLARHS
ncbi:hypothetical protein ACIHFD_36105 [Nonomuraea sp. NPDC051941]|uniref:hypothetical protein n=1 Tax=Nonomuraea sp. NPDC051941 TaxID=3364373 RepID=UPI0037C63F34